MSQAHGGARRGAGRPRKGLEGKHSAFRYLTEEGEAAMAYLAKTGEFRGAPFWYVVSKALTVLVDLRKFDDPAEHLDVWKARDYQPWNVREALRRYQRMVPGLDQKTMAAMVGIHPATFNGYVSRAESVPKAVLARARDVCRELCLGRDPDVNQHGAPISWPRGGIREGLAGGKSPLAVSIDEWLICLTAMEIWLRSKYPQGLAVADFKGPTWVAWKLLPPEEKAKLVKPDGFGVVVVGSEKPKFGV